MKKVIYGIIILLVIILGGIIIYFAGFSSGEITGEVNADPNKEFVSEEEANKMEKCEALKLSEKDNPRIELKIGEGDKNPDSLGAPKKVYNLGDFAKLSYGFMIKISKDNKPLYTKVEICRGDKTITFTDLSLSREEMQEGTYGNMIQFDNMQANGVVEKTIKEPGQYTLYAYTSTDGKNWFIAKKVDFEVK